MKMNPSQATPSQIRRDFIFFVSGIPDQMRVLDQNNAFVAVGEPEKKAITDISKKSEHGQAIADWLGRTAGRFTAAIFRKENINERDAFLEAFEKLSGILDGYAFFIEDAALEICPLFLVRQHEEEGAQIKLFGNYGWISWGSTSEAIDRAWQNRQNQLLQRFLVFFNAVAGDKPEFNTEVVNQLGLSAKMFRHGRRSQTYGIEFLCKFTALEGLVCGSEKRGHKGLLKSRLSSLFRAKIGVEAEIETLWEMRCEASHQGKAFSVKFGTVIEPLENLTLGAMVFALDHLSSVKSIDELWTKAPAYFLPAEVLMDRPKPRVPVFTIIGEVGKWPNAGIHTDKVFMQLSKML